MIKAVSAFVSLNKLVIQFVGTVLPAKLCLEVPLRFFHAIDGEMPDFNDIEVRTNTVRFGKVFYLLNDLIYEFGPLLPEVFDIPDQGAVA